MSLWLLGQSDVFKGPPQWLSSKQSTCNAGDVGSIPGWGRSPGGENGNPLQFSCLDNSMDRGAWWATVHRVAKSQTWLSNWARIHIPLGRGPQAFWHWELISWKTDFSHGHRVRDGLGTIQGHYICCTLYFHYYYIVIHNAIMIQLSIMENSREPWVCFPAARRSRRGWWKTITPKMLCAPLRT